MSSLRYLRAATSLCRVPTPAILHRIMLYYVLDQPNPTVRLAASRYLHTFLFLQLGREKVAKGQDRWPQHCIALLYCCSN